MNKALTSGYGQYHTNEFDPKKPDKLLTPYLAIDCVAIQGLVDNPQEVDKTQAQWLIPSSYPSRNFKEQEQHGEYWLLWADLDGTFDKVTKKLIKPAPSIDKLKEIIPSLIGGCDYELYNSRGATNENPKARILIPLDKPLCYADWNLAQETLNDKLEALDIEPDRKSERSAQICYLPNRGAIYDCWWVRDNGRFNPMQSWQAEIDAKRKKIEDDAFALEAAKQQTMAKKAALKQPNNFGNLTQEQAFIELKNAFNEAYTPQDWLTTYGYGQKGNSFRHPNSESGSFSCGVKEIDGIWKAHALSPNDPLYSNGQGAHDAFSAFCTLMHGGDKNAAIKDAGDNLLSIDCVSWNKAKQREYMKQEQAKKEQEQPQEKTGKTPFSLTQFSLNGRSAEMRKKMLSDTFVLPGIAILGQVTAIYAKPNTGKTLLTLHLLSDSITKGLVKGDDVFYINADDTYKGLIEKTELGERNGFHMLAPDHNGFNPKEFSDYLEQMTANDKASGKVLILDTVKKFTDLMDKKTGSKFMETARSFVSHGGTLIMLAHVNKHRDGEGKVIYAGTTDLVDDSDCAFTLDEVSSSVDIKSVLFENFKCRGDVSKESGYTYSTAAGQSYIERLRTVKPLDEQQFNDAINARKVAERMEKDAPVISAIIEELSNSSLLKSDLLAIVHANSGLSKARISKILNDYAGTDYSNGHRWFIVPGTKNAKEYCLLTTSFKKTTASEYSQAKGT